MPVNNERKLKITIIFEFFSPEYLNISISLFSNNLIKKSWIVNNKINGAISNISAGEFNKDKNSVKVISTFSSLKNSSSLNKFNTKTKLPIIKNTKKSDLKKIDEINFI